MTKKCLICEKQYEQSADAEPVDAVFDVCSYSCKRERECRYDAYVDPLGFYINKDFDLD